MSKYSYKLYKQNRPVATYQNHYRYSELSNMTTYQLRDICCKERLIKSVLDPLNREELIRLIMRYRGKSEASFIKTYNEEGFERLSQFIQNTKLLCDNTKTLKVPAKIAIYQDLEVSIHDAYEVTCKETLNEGNVLLVNEDYEICTIFNLVELGKDRYYLTKTKALPIKNEAKKQYSLLYFEQTESDLLYNLYYGIETHVPAYIKHCKAPILELSIKTLRETELPLVIDFGTSNTTAGIYENEMKYVKTLTPTHMEDTFKKEQEITNIIPSVVAIKSIKENQIEYAFGYEAIRLSKQSYLDEETPIFYDIKRWVSDSERTEKITAIDGQYTLVQRKQILKAYLQYIIELAQQQFKYRFKNIELLTPVTQSEKFHKLFKELLVGYEVSCDINEGMAIVFQSIYQLIEKKIYTSNHWYKALIIDCGGGTTDLTACQFKIDNHRIAYTINIQNSYENGDTNFGGNNLTFRIMQLLKIMLAEKISHQKYTKTHLARENAFRQVDECGKDKIYEQLDNVYRQAEEVLPTQFKNYENKNLSSYFKVKSNFYYLFEVAEKIKKKFFMKQSIYELNIGIKEEDVVDEREEFILIDKWKISIRQSEGEEVVFLPLYDIEPIKLYWYEINNLLEADIYALIKKFLEEQFEEDLLVQYDMIKLTGQSCNISLFRDALKEFIPGRFIQEGSKQKDQKELKLECIKGALNYIQSKKLGYMEINQDFKISALPYEVTSYTHTGEEKVLLHSLQKESGTGFISRFKEGIELQLILKDMEGNLLKVYYYNHELERFKETTFEEIESQYDKHIIQDETDNIVDGEIKYFVWCDKVDWGFNILPVSRENERLYVGEKKFFNFEDDTWEENFFDGLK